VISIIFGTRWP